MNIRKFMVNLPRRAKRAVVIICDLAMFGFALWLGFSLRLSVFYTPPSGEFTLLLLSAPVIGVITFHFVGLYKLVTRFIGNQGVIRIVLAVSLSVLIWAIIVLMAQIPGLLPRSTFIIYWLLSVIFIWSSRQIAGYLLRTGTDFRQSMRSSSNFNGNNVLIYGAGFAGIQLAEALGQRRNYRVAGFIDDNHTLWRQIVGGHKVYAPKDVGAVIARMDVKEIFLAISSISRRRRREILAQLEAHTVSVRTLPAVEDIVSGRVSVGDLRPVNASDLLGRDPVPPDPDLLRNNIYNKAVLVTGAGGSIGSELTRQVLELRPHTLVMLELSEVALYQIEQEIIQLEGEIAAKSAKVDQTEASELLIASEQSIAKIPYKKTIIVCTLGSVGDGQLVGEIIKSNAIETIYHAAAYKHVPIVELNPVAGLKNNTFGTAEIARVAKENGVERFVLISTDKAVRPTNIMGASKRLAEMILQAHGNLPKSEKKDTKTVFTMVRFGNVLDSSGSVVRKFRQQIKAGGPVTVTHKDIIRYFMSVTEAAQLVIQAGAMAKGGEVFILNMGEPVSIDSLARSMIKLTGLNVLDEANPDGDIEIKYTGPRPGEKLYEELLIGDDATKSANARIMIGNEAFLPMDELNQHLEALKSAMDKGDLGKIKKILTQTVDGYHCENLQMNSSFVNSSKS